MIIKMDKMSAPSRERAERLYEKNAELESRRRKSAQARVPSDPNIWQQMRENYEAIILEDHAFSEQHNVEHALWQLHYKKIEELRAHYNTAQAAAQGGKGHPRPDRITKIRQHFKTFLSEATGFYHDLIMKIRAKYGLPLAYFPDDSENRDDEKSSNEMKKAFISCHRCLIYLGDLARYKGLYGDADSKAREYAAASSYYMQAASLWPSIGNPHHQLAILASYSGDDFLTVYRYFRSLSVESPCSTARDNLIVAFEKNRQSVAQLVGDVKASSMNFAGKGRGRGAKSASKDAEKEAVVKGFNAQDAYRSFCIRFVRMNGILFTRTSLETFAEVLSVVSSGLRDLLSTGLQEELYFGIDPSENGLFFVRLVTILIFTVHNAKRESEGQTYAEIVQRAVLLQNALTAIFQIMALILERSEQLSNPSSSYLLPCTLVFVEWLACYPDIAAGDDADEKQATCRSNFWDHFISFTNKLLSFGSISVDDSEDETCFNSMSRYEEADTENRLALWEDIELRGFMPLHPAHSILDFSRKHNFGKNDCEENSSRVKRILAAVKAIAGIVRVGQKAVHYDPREKKFITGVEPLKLDDFAPSFDFVVPEVNVVASDNGEEQLVKVGGLQPHPQFCVEGEEEEEEIVFRPTLSEKTTEVNGSTYLHGGFEPVKSPVISDPAFSGGVVSNAFDNMFNQTAADHIPPEPFSIRGTVSQSINPVQVHPWNRLSEKELALASSLKGLTLLENGHVIKSEVQNNTDFHTLQHFVPQHSAIPSTAVSYNHANVLAPAVLPSRSGAVSPIGGSAENLAVKFSSALSSGYKKSPVSRQVRHLGPPPGFNPVPKQVQEPISGAENPILDDYSWLDGYQMSSSKTPEINHSVTYAANGNKPYNIGGNTGMSAAVSFPFPGKQVPPLHIQTDRQKGWQGYQAFDNLKPHIEQQLQMSRQMLNGNQDFGHLSEHYLGSIWSGHHFV